MDHTPNTGIKNSSFGFISTFGPISAVDRGYDPPKIDGYDPFKMEASCMHGGKSLEQGSRKKGPVNTH